MPGLGEDTDDDNDSVPDTDDLCQTGEMGWNSTSNNDWDSDGCLDSTEDDDDDNDSLEDGLDSCATGGPRLDLKLNIGLRLRRPPGQL